VMLTYARRIIQARDEMQHCLAEFTSLATGRVRIAAHESAAQYLLPAPLAAFHAEHPKIKIVTRLCDVQEVANLVAGREADLGCGIKQSNLRGLRAEVIHSDPLVLVVAPGHRLAQCDVVRIEELGGEQFFLHHSNTQTADTIQHLFAEHRTPFEVAAELWNFETVKHFVRAGDGVAIIPMSVAKADIDSRRLVAVGVRELEITRSIEIVYRDEQRLLPAPLQLLEILRKYEWDRDVPRPRSVALGNGMTKTPRR
jgi:DNA-binding transcriptional LysR family regulator